jgi:hypothetical protein
LTSEPSSEIDPTDEPLRSVEGFSLSKDTYERWRDTLLAPDRAEFDLRGGTENLLRFVCAFSLLSSRQEYVGANAILLAYAMAFSLDPGDSSLEPLAARAWNRDCVQTLFDRLNSRDRLRDARNLRARTAALTGRTIEDAFGLDVETRTKAIGAANAFLKLEAADQERIARIREKIGADDAALQIQSGSQKLDDLSVEQIRAFRKALDQAEQRKSQKALQ